MTDQDILERSNKALLFVRSYLEQEQYSEALTVALQSAEAFGSFDLYLEAAFTLFSMNNHHACLELIAEIEGAIDQEQVVVLSLKLISQLQCGLWAEAGQTAAQIEGLQIGQDWVREIQGICSEEYFSPDLSSGKWLKELAKKREFWPNLRGAEAGSDDNVPFAYLHLGCRNCEAKFKGKLAGTLFQLKLMPCPNCFRPYVAHPAVVGEELAKRSQLVHPERIKALDSYLWSWVHGWPRGLKSPSAVPWASDMPAELYFPLRHFLVGRCLARLNKELEQHDG